LGSAELAAVCSLLGKLPTVEEYLAVMANKIDPFAADLYRYLNFDRMLEFSDEAEAVKA
jgi:aconitate hydratase 2 / 2-methylisocitrate dehydratase